MSSTTVEKILRPQEITTRYERLLDQHMAERLAGTSRGALGIQDFAAKLFIHPVHLSNTLQTVTGRSPCDLYEERLMAITRELLRTRPGPVAEVARHLGMDPSNFSKFFKRYAGITPKQYRQEHVAQKRT